MNLRGSHSSDEQLRSELKSLDKKAGLFFLSTTILLILFLKKEIISFYLIIVFIPACMILYLILFRKLSGEIQSKETKFLVRSSKDYTFHYVCESLLFLFAIMTVCLVPDD